MLCCHWIILGWVFMNGWLCVNADPGLANEISVTHNSQDDFYISSEWNEVIWCFAWTFCSEQSLPSCLSVTQSRSCGLQLLVFTKKQPDLKVVSLQLWYILLIFSPNVICVTDEKLGWGWQIKFEEKNEIKKLDQKNESYCSVIYQTEVTAPPLSPFITFTALTCPPWPLSIKQTVSSLIPPSSGQPPCMFVYFTIFPTLILSCIHRLDWEQKELCWLLSSQSGLLTCQPTTDSWVLWHHRTNCHLLQWNNYSVVYTIVVITM